MLQYAYICIFNILKHKIFYSQVQMVYLEVPAHLGHQVLLVKEAYLELLEQLVSEVVMAILEEMVKMEAMVHLG